MLGSGGMESRGDETREVERAHAEGLAPLLGVMRNHCIFFKPRK